jgi:protease-4
LRIVAIVLSLILILAIIDVWYSDERISDGFCNVAVFPIEGVILPFDSYENYPLITTPKAVRDFVEKAENDMYVEGLLLEINSPGGTPVASEQISEIIRGTSLSTVSLIGDLGASGAYLVAASADKVLASSMSDVGSIGVTMSYTENSKKNEEEGVTFVELASGEFKDAGNPNKPLSEEERELFEADLELVHQEFVKKVAEMRGKSVEEIQALADGSSMPGVRALEKGLIDAVGNRQTARQEFAKTLGINEDQVIFCEYSGGLLLF